MARTGGPLGGAPPCPSPRTRLRRCYSAVGPAAARWRRRAGRRSGAAAAKAAAERGAYEAATSPSGQLKLCVLAATPACFRLLARTRNPSEEAAALQLPVVQDHNCGVQCAALLPLQ